MTTDVAPDYRPPEKRSLTLRRHRTSVSLERAFWDALRAEAAARGQSINGLASQIDAARPPGVGLATALRLYVLALAQSRAVDGRPHPMVASAGKVSSSQ